MAVSQEYQAVSRTYRGDMRPQWARTLQTDTFRCRQCKLLVGLLPSGGRQRNHCPYCLHSRHLDDHRPGDRASGCGALMAPIGMLVRRNGEYAIVHRCLACGVFRHNRIAADDDFDLVLALQDLTAAERD
jgi:hypothetical protein